MKTMKARWLSIGCLCTLFVLFLVYFNRTNSNLELQRNEWHSDEHMILINQNIEDENIQSDKNIYFIETKDSSFHNLDARQACSIESAGK